MREMNSFQDAFYIIAKELGFDYAQPLSPREVFEQQILPRIRELVATQPAAGEPKPIGYISETVRQELLNGKHVPANICTATPSRRNPHPGPDANWSVPIFVAPPAAAYGDEAVRFESPEALAKALFDHGSIVTSRLVADRIFAAMRAQGDGEVQ